MHLNGRYRTLLVTLALATPLAACALPSQPWVPPALPTATPAVDGETRLSGTEWMVTSLQGGDLLEGSNITLSFAEGRASGFAGCNGYGAGYVATPDGGLTIDVMEITLQACLTPEGIMEQEADYVEALSNAAAYRIVDDQLEINDSSGQTILLLARRPEVESDPSALLGTRWRLQAMNDTIPSEGAVFTLFFHDEGLLSGRAACRDYVAAYEASGDDISLLSLGMIGEICQPWEPLMEEKARYTSMLELVTNYVLTDQQLQLLTAAGQVLTYERDGEDPILTLEDTPWALLALVERRDAEGMEHGLLLPGGLTLFTEITAAFDGRMIIGSSGCNTYHAAYAQEGASLTFDGIAVTRMACASPEGIMGQEQRYLQLLEGVVTHRISGQRLWLHTADGQALLYGVQPDGYDMVNLLQDLQAHGLSVEPTGDRVDHGFSREGWLVLANGVAVFVYEFADVSEAEEASRSVWADEGSMTVTRLEGSLTREVHSDWLGTPHLFHEGRLIVITGDNPELLGVLDSLLGPQFAPTAKPTPSATPAPTLGPPECTYPDDFPVEEAELVWPALLEIEPQYPRTGDSVTVWGHGGYLYWDGDCGPYWDESARSFQLFFDGNPWGWIECYVNTCVAVLTVPMDAVPGSHVLKAEGGSTLHVSVILPEPTATPSATPAPSATPTPPPTPTPSPTPTATLIPTPTPLPPVILTFEADRTEVDPGDTVRLTWTSSDGATASVRQWSAHGVPGPTLSVPVSGSMDIVIGDTERLWHEFVLTVANPSGPTRSPTLRINIHCPYSYFFELPPSWGPDHCPLKPPALTWSAEQPFEGGRMIWQQGIPAESTADGVALGPIIYVLYYADPDDPSRGGEVQVFEDTWTDAELESDPSIIPPGGLYQPIRGFGKVWRSNPAVRDQLGWALEPEQGFDGAYQVDWRDPYQVVGSRYIDTREGLIIWLGDFGTWGWVNP